MTGTEGRRPDGDSRQGRVAMLEPLSTDTIMESLDRLGLRWSRDSEGEVHLFVDGSLFYLLVLGEAKHLLHVRGRWRRSLPAALAADAARFCLDWHSRYAFPKTYVTSDSQGRVHLVGEVSTDLSAGVAAEQLDRLLRSALATTAQAFAEAENRFPDRTVAAAPPTS